MDQTQPKSKQEIFNIVAKHLLTQKERAVLYYKVGYGGGPNLCAYLTGSGLRCAIGVLLTQSDPKILEGLTGSLTRPEVWSEVKKSVDMSIFSSDAEAMEFLVRLQMIHDGETPGYWNHALRDFASRYDLSTAEMP